MPIICSMTAKTSRGGAAATNLQLWRLGASRPGSSGAVAMRGIVRIAPAGGARRRSGEERTATQGESLDQPGERPQWRPQRRLLAAEVAQHLAVPAALELEVAGAGGGGVLVVRHSPHVVDAAALVQAPLDRPPVQQVGGLQGGVLEGAAAEEIDQARAGGDRDHARDGGALHPGDQ